LGSFNWKENAISGVGLKDIWCEGILVGRILVTERETYSAHGFFGKIVAELNWGNKESENFN